MSFGMPPAWRPIRESPRAGGMRPTRPPSSSPPPRRRGTARRLQIVLPARRLDLVVTVARRLEIVPAVTRRLLVLPARRLQVVAGRRRVRGGRREHRGERDRECVRSLHVFLLHSLG